MRSNVPLWRSAVTTEKTVNTDALAMTTPIPPLNTSQLQVVWPLSSQLLTSNLDTSQKIIFIKINEWQNLNFYYSDDFEHRQKLLERFDDSQKHKNTGTWILMINDSDVVERKLLFELTQIHQILNVFLWIFWLDKVWFHEFYEIFDDAFNIILLLRSFR